jgi:3-hydroxyacyl-[acyl-carrier-protein] dehydratase
MILKDSLFTILERQNLDGQTTVFRVKWIPENIIYKAHFPDNPITPGACLIQMAIELLNLAKDMKFSIKTLKNVKFTAPVNPLKFPETDFLFEYSEHNLKVVIKENEMIFAKMSLVLA